MAVHWVLLDSLGALLADHGLPDQAYGRARRIDRLSRGDGPPRHWTDRCRAAPARVLTLTSLEDNARLGSVDGLRGCRGSRVHGLGEDHAGSQLERRGDVQAGS